MGGFASTTALPLLDEDSADAPADEAPFPAAGVSIVADGAAAAPSVEVDAALLGAADGACGSFARLALDAPDVSLSGAGEERLTYAMPSARMPTATNGKNQRFPAGSASRPIARFAAAAAALFAGTGALDRLLAGADRVLGGALDTRAAGGALEALAGGGALLFAAVAGGGLLSTTLMVGGGGAGRSRRGGGGRVRSVPPFGAGGGGGSDG